MILPSFVLSEAILPFKEFGTFNAVPLAETGEIFCWFGGFMQGEMVRRAQVGVDLVKGSGQAFGFYAADCAHDV